MEDYLLHLLATNTRTPEQHAQWRQLLDGADREHSGN
jgi:hypothetical protein